MSNLLKIIVCFLIVSTLFSCKKHIRTIQKQQKDTLLSREIIFPNQLKLFKNKRFSQIDSFLLNTKGKTKLISIVDGNCPKCIDNQLNRIDASLEFITDNPNSELIFILNVLSEDSVYFMRHIESSINTQATILWDNNYNFESCNKLFTPDINLRTFMIDSDNRIVQYGNPLFNPDVISKYRDKLK
ncbi:MAG: hypothetical protein MI739_02450 [Bacteroidales bacterium]|nr:hypothetical protein [Bacteroidales bacterium]